jgi:hypothetical protein
MMLGLDDPQIAAGRRECAVDHTVHQRADRERRIRSDQRAQAALQTYLSTRGGDAIAEPRQDSRQVLLQIVLPGTS